MNTSRVGKAVLIDRLCEDGCKPVNLLKKLGLNWSGGAIVPNATFSSFVCPVLEYGFFLVWKQKSPLKKPQSAVGVLLLM
jgi:hypothetical protein